DCPSNAFDAVDLETQRRLSPVAALRNHPSERARHDNREWRAVGKKALQHLDLRLPPVRARLDPEGRRGALLRGPARNPLANLITQLAGLTEHQSRPRTAQKRCCRVERIAIVQRSPVGYRKCPDHWSSHLGGPDDRCVGASTTGCPRTRR